MVSSLIPFKQGDQVVLTYNAGGKQTRRVHTIEWNTDQECGVDGWTFTRTGALVNAPLEVTYAGLTTAALVPEDRLFDHVQIDELMEPAA